MKSTRSLLFYLPTDSPFFNINSVTKLTLIVSISVLLLLYANLALAIFLFAFTLVLFGVAKLDFKKAGQFILLILWFTLFTSYTYLGLSQIPGEFLLFTWPWGDYITESTIIMAFTQIFRYEGLMLSTMLYLSTTKDQDIINSLRFLRVRYSICFMFSLALRSVTMFLDDYRTIKEAMSSKGIDYEKGNFLTKAIKSLYLMWPLIFLMFSRVREITFAVESRGFGAFKNRTQYKILRWTKVDFVIVIGCLVGVFGLFILHNILGYNLPLHVPGWS